MAAMVFTDTLIKSLENGDFVIGVYLDFPKAFDTVDQEILKKFTIMALEGIVLNGFKVTYLTANDI